MKKLFSLLISFAFLSAVHAQNEKMVRAMSGTVAQLDSFHTAEKWTSAANQFQRIAEAEKTEWLPYYYAALSTVMSGLMIGPGQADKTDPLADKAEAMVAKAEAIEKDNAEIWILKKMIANLRMNADPMTRWQTYGMQGQEALAKAKAIEPENPRIFLLEGQDKFFTPEQFGGSKTEARVLFETSVKKFEETKPKSDVHPHWGLSQANYFLAQIK